MSRKKKKKTPLIREQENTVTPRETGPSYFLKIHAVPPALFLGLFLLYALMLCPDVPAGDSGELITAAATCGIAHPPGYPLFTMLGKLFTFIPYGTIAWRVNLMSALLHAAAATLTYGILLLTLRSAIPALVGALFLAFSTIFWRYSLVAEVFPLNDFLLAFLIFLLIFRAEKISQTGPSSVQPLEKGLLFLWCFLLGLAFSNHLTILFVLPAFIYFFWRSDPFALKPGVLLTGFLFFLLGLLPYLYLPLASAAGPYLNWDNPSEPAGFLRLVTRSDYGTLTLSPTDTSRPSPFLQIPIYLSSLGREFTIVGLILALLGLWGLFKKNRRLFNFLIMGFLLSGPLFLMMGNMDPGKPSFPAVIARFHLMPGLFFSLFIGFGANFILKNLPALWQDRSWKNAVNAALALLLLASILLPFLMHFAPVIQRANYLTRDYGENALLGLPENALLLATGDTFLASLDYLKAAEKMRPDVLIVEEKVKFPWYVSQLKKRCPKLSIPFDCVDMKTHFIRDIVDANIKRFPIFVHHSSDASLRDHYDLLPLGLVTRVLPKGQLPAARDYQKQLEIALGRCHVRDQERLNHLQPFDFENEILYSYAMMHYDIGNAWIRWNEFQKAEKSWLRAVALSPETAAPYKDLGVLYAYHARSPGSGALAVEYWQKYLTLNPRDPDREKIESEIARILSQTDKK
ncbi:MAG: DUF2723 domain-containing protein [bacterium]